MLRPWGSSEVNNDNLGAEVDGTNYIDVVILATCICLLKSKLVSLSSLPIFICRTLC